MDDVFLIDYEAWTDRPTLLGAIAVAASLLCFFTLYLIADDHLNRALELLARRCRLSPSMAGLTLLAFGNGASDFFTAVIGVAGSPTMVLGSSMGAGLFIAGVVMGLTIVFARTEHCDIKVPSKTLSIARGPFLKSLVLYLWCVLLVLYLGHSRRISLWQPIALIGMFALYMASAVYSHWRKSKTDLPDIDCRKKASLEDDLLTESVCDSIDSKSLADQMATAVGKHLNGQLSKGNSRLLIILKCPIDVLLAASIPPLGEDDGEDPEERALSRFFAHYRSLVFPATLALLVSLVLLANKVNNLHIHGVIVIAALLLTGISYYHRKKWRRPSPVGIHSILGAFLCSLFWIYIVTKELLNALAAIGRASGVDEAILGLTILAWGNSCGDLVSNLTLARNGHAETAIIAALSGPIQNVLLTLGVSFTIACLSQPNWSIQLEPPEPTFYLTSWSLIIYLALLLVLVAVVFRYKLPRHLGVGLLLGYGLYLLAGTLTILSSKK